MSIQAKKACWCVAHNCVQKSQDRLAKGTDHVGLTPADCILRLSPAAKGQAWGTRSVLRGGTGLADYTRMVSGQRDSARFPARVEATGCRLPGQTGPQPTGTTRTLVILLNVGRRKS